MGEKGQASAAGNSTTTPWIQPSDLAPGGGSGEIPATDFAPGGGSPQVQASSLAPGGSGSDSTSSQASSMVGTQPAQASAGEKGQAGMSGGGSEVLSPRSNSSSGQVPPVSFEKSFDKFDKH